MLNHVQMRKPACRCSTVGTFPLYNVIIIHIRQFRFFRIPRHWQTSCRAFLTKQYICKCVANLHASGCTDQNSRNILRCPVQGKWHTAYQHQHNIWIDIRDLFEKAALICGELRSLRSTSSFPLIIGFAPRTNTTLPNMPQAFWLPEAHCVPVRSRSAVRRSAPHYADPLYRLRRCGHLALDPLSLLRPNAQVHQSKVPLHSMH